MVESSNLVIYGLARVVLGASTSASTVGLYEGPVRAHNVIYALNQAVGLTTLPLAARYTASGDTRRLRELAVRGSRYSLAFVVPLCVTLAVMSTPLLELWLGERYGEPVPRRSPCSSPTGCCGASSRSRRVSSWARGMRARWG